MNTKAEKSKLLQGQFICPIFAVWFGMSCNVYFTRYHAEQMLRALRLNGTECWAFDGKGIAL